MLELDGVSIASFREVSGISSETTVIESKETSKDGKTIIKKLPGEHKWGDITFKRGYTKDLTLYKWRQVVLEGKTKDMRKNGSIVVYDYENKEVLRWNFVNAWPSKLSASNLSASGNEVLVEEVTICHEGMARQK
ncbi:MAG: phage tail protein [Chloroflexi bacterium]|nr:phage tail protein [Chloroflexota bacterium]